MPTTTAHGIVKPAAGTEPADLYGVATRLADSVETAIAPSAWTAPTFTGTWVNFGAPYNTAAYRKTGDEVVLRGVIKDGTLGTSAFTLPAGFRPPNDAAFATDSNAAYARITVGADGTVKPDVGSTASVKLGVVRFSVTA